MTFSLQAALVDVGLASPLEPPDIDANEVSSGIVVRLDPAVLLCDDRTFHTQDPPVRRPGPFVCIAADADELTVWAGITTGARRHRLAIASSWRSGGNRQWRETPQFLTDGASLWCGPKTAFVAASYEERATVLRNRARISPAGVEVIRREIGAQAHRRDRPIAGPIKAFGSRATTSERLNMSENVSEIPADVGDRPRGGATEPRSGFTLLVPSGSSGNPAESGGQLSGLLPTARAPGPQIEPEDDVF